MPNPSIEETLQKGMAFHNNRQLIEAEACYREVLKVDPDNADAIYLLGLLAEAIGDRDLAADLIKNAIAIQPSNILFHSSLAIILKSQGKSDQAIECYLNALKLDPNHADILLGLASLYHEAGKLDEAISTYRQYLKIKPGEAVCKDRLAIALLGNGLRLENLGRNDEAMLCYKESLLLSPGLTQSRDRLNLLSPTRTEANPVEEHLQLGLEFHLDEQFQEAASRYREALSIDPDHSLAEDLLGLATDALEDRQLIDEASSAIIPERDKSTPSRAAHGYDTDLQICNLKLDLVEKRNEILRLNDKIRIIESKLRSIIQSSSRWNFVPALQHAISLQNNGKLDEALGIGELVLELHPQNKAALTLIMDLAVAYHQRRDLATSERIYSKLLEINPSNIDALHLLGLIHSQRHQYGKAFALVERSLQTKAPAPPHFYKNAGLIAEKLPDPVKAEAYLRKAIALNKTYAEAHSCLAQLLIRQKRFDEAEKCLSEAIALIPDSNEIADQLHFLNYKARPLSRKAS